VVLNRAPQAFCPGAVVGLIASKACIIRNIVAGQEIRRESPPQERHLAIYFRIRPLRSKCIMSFQYGGAVANPGGLDRAYSVVSRKLCYRPCFDITVWQPGSAGVVLDAFISSANRECGGRRPA